MIEIAYCRVPGGNFGDDLNETLWKHALPKQVYESEKILLIGVGSLLHSKFLDGLVANKRKVVVFGSGACYGKLKSIPNTVQFSVLRGPLSAAMTGQMKASVTDGAALLALPEVRKALLPNVANRGKVVFMPHHDSFRFSNWDIVTKKAGLEMIDPRNNVKTILEQIGSARLVITEAMHGAVVADTLRIPWIPVKSSWRIQSFKWNDWTMSLKLPYKPTWIPSSSINDGLARRIDKRKLNASTDWQIAYETQPLNELRQMYNGQYDNEIEGNVKKSFSKRMFGKTAKRIAPVFDQISVYRAIKSLSKLSEQAGFLSEERVFQDRLSCLHARADGLRALA